MVSPGTYLIRNISYLRVVVIWCKRKSSSRKIYVIIVVKEILVITNVIQMVAAAKRSFFLKMFFFDFFQIWIIYWSKNIKWIWDICFANVLMLYRSELNCSHIDVFTPQKFTLIDGLTQQRLIAWRPWPMWPEMNIN